VTRTATALGIVASALLHTLLLGALAIAAPPTRDHRRKPTPVEIALTSRPKPLPVQPPPPPPQPVPVPVAPILRHRAAPPETTRPIEMPPPVVTSERPSEAPANDVPSFGVSMEATVQGGNIAVPVGGSVLAQPNARGSGIATPGPSTPAVTPPVTKPPTVTRAIEAPYPREARDEGIQGKVTLVVTVGPDGRVVRVRVVKGLGYGLDEAAVAAVKQFQFKPGTVDGRAAEMDIRYTYTFEISE
jgi:periplasmic protein TonB